MKQLIQTTIIAVALCLVSVSEAKTVRATEMNPSLWKSLAATSAGDLVVEFRKGDELPVVLTSEGDLLETTQNAASYVSVKRDFWVRVYANNLEMSLDGTSFKPFNDLVTGSITVGTGSAQNGGPANAINIVHQTYLK